MKKVILVLSIAVMAIIFNIGFQAAESHAFPRWGMMRFSRNNAVDTAGNSGNFSDIPEFCRQMMTNRDDSEETRPYGNYQGGFGCH
jgi:hypothetical protein